MAVLGLRLCARAFSSCGKRGPLFIAVRGPLTIAASLVAEHRLQTRRLSNCGSWAQSLHGMWDPPRPGLEPVSPALAGRLPTTAPPGKPPEMVFILQSLVLPLSNIIEVLEKENPCESVFDEPTFMRGIFKPWSREEPSLNSVARCDCYVLWPPLNNIPFVLLHVSSFIRAISIVASLYWTINFRRVGSVCSLQCPLSGLEHWRHPLNLKRIKWSWE